MHRKDVLLVCPDAGEERDSLLFLPVPAVVMMVIFSPAYRRRESAEGRSPTLVCMCERGWRARPDLFIRGGL